MNETRMNTSTIKLINTRNVYMSIYNAKKTCKHDITVDLGMGLSTVNQNLKLLESEGFIRKNGYFDSTGGRKADALEIVNDARIAIGVSITRSKVHILSSDLYGDILDKISLDLSFSNSANFYKELSTEIISFIEKHDSITDRILGISIATQGIVSADGKSVSYGQLLNNNDMTLADFQKFLPYPCHLIHDSKAAATLELFNKPEITDAILLLLNHNMGGALITNGQVHNGLNMGSGIIEHMTINIDGDTCYCGRKGCLETYCSLDRLKDKAGVEHTDIFFQSLRNLVTFKSDCTSDIPNDDTISKLYVPRQDKSDMIHNLSDVEKEQIKISNKFQTLWNNYLHNLSKAITSLSLLIDGHYIISGVLAPYLTSEDMDVIIANINEHRLFPLSKDRFILGESGRYTQALGAALYYVNDFLDNTI